MYARSEKSDDSDFDASIDEIHLDGCARSIAVEPVRAIFDRGLGVLIHFPQTCRDCRQRGPRVSTKALGTEFGNARSGDSRDLIVLRRDFELCVDFTLIGFDGAGAQFDLKVVSLFGEDVVTWSCNAGTPLVLRARPAGGHPHVDTVVPVSGAHRLRLRPVGSRIGLAYHDGGWREVSNAPATTDDVRLGMVLEDWGAPDRARVATDRVEITGLFSR